MTGNKHDQKEKSTWTENHPHLWNSILMMALWVLVPAAITVIITGYGVSVMEKISFGDTITFLGFILAFASFAVYFLFEINKRDMQQQAKDLGEKFNDITTQITKNTVQAEFNLRDERVAAYAESMLAPSISLVFVHQFICKDHKCEVSQTDTNHKLCAKHYDDDLVKQSVYLARNALNKLETELRNKTEYRDLIIKCKNNLVVSLTFKSDPTSNEADEARRYSSELYQLMLSGTKMELPNYAIEAMRALVLLRFSTASSDADKRESNMLYQKIADDKSIESADKEIIQKNRKFVESILEFELEQRKMVQRSRDNGQK